MIAEAVVEYRPTIICYVQDGQVVDVDIDDIACFIDGVEVGSDNPAARAAMEWVTKVVHEAMYGPSS